MLLEHTLLVGRDAQHDAEHDHEGHVHAEEHPERRGRVVGLQHSARAEREENAREHVDADEAQRDEQQISRRVAAAEHAVGRGLGLLGGLDFGHLHVVDGHLGLHLAGHCFLSRESASGPEVVRLSPL